MAVDRIEREILIAASRTRVWEIITKAEHVGTWFGESAQVDLRPGGTIALYWAEYGTFYGTIEKIDEPQYFSYRWVPGTPNEAPTEKNSTLVEFTLTPAGAQTRLRVVESGFAQLPLSERERAEQFDDNSEGWASKLGSLQRYAEQLPA